MAAGGAPRYSLLRHCAKGAKHFLASSYRAVSGRINWRVVLAVLLALTAIISFAAQLPPWITATTVAVAFGAGVLHAGSYRRTLIAIVLPIVIVVSGAAYLLAHNNSGQAASAHRVAAWVPVGPGLEASLEVKNVTYKPEWGSTIEADAYDELQFRLIVKNRGATPSSPRIIRLTASEKGETYAPRVIAATFGRAHQGPFEPGPEVKIIPQSNGVADFHAYTLVFGRPSKGATHLTGLGDFLPWTNLSWAYEYELPAISAHSSLLISVLGGFNTPEEEPQLSGGPLEFKNLSDSGAHYATEVAARPGDVLLAAALLNNVSFRSTNAQVWVHFRSHNHGTYEEVGLDARDTFQKAARELGHGLVNAEPGEPIRLQIVPGTTEVKSAGGKCSEEASEALPDGITEGGVEVKEIGGFKQRDPCSGGEFAKWLFFELKVLPKRG